MKLKQITEKDQLDLKNIYFDSVVSINESVYTSEQKRVWASQAWENKNFNLFTLIIYSRLGLVGFIFLKCLVLLTL